MLSRHVVLFLTLLACYAAQAQPCTNPGQVPGSEFPVCGATVFSQTVVPECSGNIIPTLCPAMAGINYSDKNPYWYKFTCFTTGTLGFIITPNTITDDYDWELFDITGHNSSEVYTDASLIVSCNWSGVTGTTGASASGSGGANCAGPGVPTFNVMPTLKKGHNYLLMVSHFDNGTQSGYTLQFAGGSTGITDTTTSSITQAVPACNGAKVSIKLNKKLKCSSLAADGSDFSISAGGITITNAIGAYCTSGFDMDSIILTLSNPLPSGTYTITAKKGSDGNTLLDYCNAEMAVGTNIQFSVMPGLPSIPDSIKPVACKPTDITVFLNSPILCSSIATDGSDFSITGPAPVSISAAVATCISGSASIIKLQLSYPIYKGGIYTLYVKQGTDGATLENACMVSTPASNYKSFTAPDTVSAALTYSISHSCTVDTARFFATANPGVTGYAWTFDNIINSSAQNVVQLFAPGNHTAQLVVSNALCSDTVRVTVAVSAIPAVTATFTKTGSYCGLGNGSASVTAAGGSGSYSYLWTPGNLTTAAITNVPSGKYTVDITDDFGCKKTASVVIDSIPGPSLTALVVADVKCFGQKNGAITASASGGTAPYTYTWTSPARTYTGNPLPQADTGKYTVKVADANGCQTTGSTVVKQPLPLVHSVKSITNTTCSNADGAASLVIMGGTAPYTYSWLPTGGSMPSATGLPAGAYVININDKNNCTDTMHLAIGSSPALTAYISAQVSSCQSFGTGSAIIANNGTAPFIYTWSPSVSTGPTATNLGAGTYIVSVSDKIGCQDTVHVNIDTVPMVLRVITKKDVSCYRNKNGSIKISAAGAQPFIYTWTPSISMGAAAMGLDIGRYSIAIKDSFGCQTADTVTITEPALLSVNVLSHSTTCGSQNGAAKAFAGGGTPPYIYSWSNGSAIDSLTNLPPGLLIVRVIDSQFCIATDSAIQIGSSVPLAATLGSGIDLCPGDSIQLYPGFFASYKWQDGSILPVYSAARAGIYKVTVTDTMGCNAEASLQVNGVCHDIKFPDGFTPNNDNRNDEFGPIGTLPSVKHYVLKVYDRWGRTVFVTADPYVRWTGKVNNAAAAPGTYVWIANYTFNGTERVKKGTIVLMR